MQNIRLVAALLTCIIATGSPQINFGTDKIEIKSEENDVRTTLSETESNSKKATGLLASFLGVAPVPAVIYNPVQCNCIAKEQCAATPGTFAYPNKSDLDGSGTFDIRIVNKEPIQGDCAPGKVFCCWNLPRPPPPVTSPPPETCGSPEIIPVPGYNSVFGQADFGEYPWTAIILDKANKFVGTGALIGKYHVLTVAHRVRDYNSYQLKVRLGEWYAKEDNEPHKYVEVGVENILIHSGFNSQNLQNDLAIIKFTEPIKPYPHIKSVCLPKLGSDFSGKRCWVAGFGKDAFKDGKESYFLKEVDLPVVNSNTCENALRQTKLGIYFQLNRDSFICAGGEVGKDSCTGDGGSSLVCKTDSGWQVAGLVAWGIGCAEGVPGVYVNVPNYADWIRTIITK